MQFVVIGTVRPNATPQIVQNAIRRYSTWKPPQDLKVVSSLSAVDHQRVFQIVETENANSIYESTLAFSDCLEFEVVAVQNSAQSVPTALKVLGATY